MRALSRLRSGLPFLAMPAAVALVALAGSPFHLRFAAEILIIGTAVLGLDLLVGVGGLVALGHAAAFGTAAYVAALLALRFGAHLPLVLLAGMLAGGVVSGLAGWLVKRMSGLFLMVGTLVVGQIFWEIAFRWREVTGGADGLRGLPPLLLDLGILRLPLAEASSLAVLATALAMAALAVARSFVAAPIGRALLAAREQPLRLSAMGYGLGRIRVTAFVVAGVIAGAAGALYPFVNQYVGPNSVHWSLSAAMVIMLVLGGAGSLHGSYVGAAVYLGIQTYVSSYTERWQTVVGLLFVATVLIAPRGLARAMVRGGRP